VFTQRLLHSGRCSSKEPKVTGGIFRRTPSCSCSFDSHCCPTLAQSPSGCNRSATAVHQRTSCAARIELILQHVPAMHRESKTAKGSMLNRMSRQQIAQRALRHVDSTHSVRMTMLQCSQWRGCSPTILSCAGHVLSCLQIL